MANLTLQEHLRRLEVGAAREALRGAGQFAPSVAETAASLGLNSMAAERYFTAMRTQYGSLSNALAAVRLALGQAAPASASTHPASRSAPAQADADPRQKVAFWKRKADAAEREAEELRHLLEEVAGLKAASVEPPEWLTQAGPEGGRSVIIAHTSDLHMGEKITPGEIEGVNAYDPEIARERMRRYFSTVCAVGPRWAHDHTCDGVLLTMSGDLIAGDIHEDLRRTNALTSTESVVAAVEVYAAGIRQLLGTYSAVHVVAVPGNHGRTTDKPPAKMVARLSYDMLVAQMVRERFADDPRVTWTLSAGIDARVPLYGRTVVVTHGDRYAKGGQGLTGPGLPMLRGAAKVKQQSASAGLACDLLLIGHFHTSSEPPGVLANGSVVGYSEYAHGLRVGVEPPQQWIARFSMRWGLCERLAARLDDPPSRVRTRAA